MGGSNGIKFLQLHIIIIILSYLLTHVSDWRHFNFTSLMAGLGPFYITIVGANLAYVQEYRPDSGFDLFSSIFLAPFYSLFILYKGFCKSSK